MRRLLPVLLVAALCGLLAGCGNDHKSENAYVNDVNQAQANLAAKLKTLAPKVSGTTTPTKAEQLVDQFKQAFGHVVTDLQAVKPPNKVKDLHAKLITELGSYNAQLDRVRAAFASKDDKRIASAQGSLERDMTRISQQVNGTLAQINAKLHE